MEYDTNGNMTRRGSLYLKYDPEDQLVKASSDSAGLSYICRYAMDGDGRRAKRVDSNGTIHYAGPHYERNVGTGADTTEKVSKYYRAQMGRVSRLVALRRKVSDSYEGLRYVVPDHLGGTIRVVDTAGTTIGDIRYHAFGGTRSGGTAMPTDQLFTGQTMDASTGLYFYQARYYDPTLCRFVQPDTIIQDIGLPQTLNRYSYALNNPPTYSDPTGHFVPLLAMAIGAVVGAGVGAGGYVIGSVVSRHEMNWSEAAVAAGVGAASGALAPVVATSAVGAVLLGAGANAVQYTATQVVDDRPVDPAMFGASVVLGAVGGRIAGPIDEQLVGQLEMNAGNNITASLDGIAVSGAAKEYVEEQVQSLGRAFFGATVSNLDPSGIEPALDNAEGFVGDLLQGAAEEFASFEQSVEDLYSGETYGGAWGE